MANQETGKSGAVAKPQAESQSQRGSGAQAQPALHTQAQPALHTQPQALSQRVPENESQTAPQATSICGRQEAITQARRIVVKIGSSSLTLPDGSLNLQALHSLVEALASRHREGCQIVLVSSGAVAAGAHSLPVSRPKTIRDKQAAAMIGQSRLMAAYENAFDRYGITIGQVLLTVTDVIDRNHYSNVQDALNALLAIGVIPVVNENDAVVTEELRFGDNDRIAALTSHLISADVLVLLTDVDGLYSAPPKEPGAYLIETVSGPEDLAGLLVTDRGSAVGTGGMRSKVAAAELAVSGGVGVLLTAASKVKEVLAGEPAGTWFAPTGERESARSLWLAHVAEARGRVVVDAGAKAALQKNRASLLAVGVMGIAGRFARGDLIEVAGPDGKTFARGLSGWSAEALAEAIDTDAARGTRPVIHANDIALG
ncbi:gamma-glutamyl kinase [Actinobaculum suis]|uniref:Glutamate 5-kinase n=1 Tax=Actinobaculum suis TaxID=1657 RepID=A0A7Z8Y8N8_9ACTO|nr:glutamate 5-kinase [Actinobaculum suis]VDG76291.1 gamma-glutamyl kinase [Actinobaculum suis]